ncbi:MAG TPA: DUF1638 domain-containing protein [Phycisphaerae bacterium]|nr:DUF1638 domain-containing protein [Phycisphaerae bacterium]
MVKNRKKIALIACQALKPELESMLQDMPHIVHCEFFELGLHDQPSNLRQTLQNALDLAEAIPSVEAVVFAYGLCSRSIEGVTARRCEMVFPRVHDCRAIILGSRKLYDAYIAEKPTSYWYSPGWLLDRPRAPSAEKLSRLKREYVEKYGEDNAEYLMEMEQDWITKYNTALYVDTGVGDADELKSFTRDCAASLGWAYEELQGSRNYLRSLVECDWNDEDFVIVPPGSTVAMTDDGRVMEVVRKKD